MTFYYDTLKEMDCLGDLEIHGMIIIVITHIKMKLVTRIHAVASTLKQNITEHMAQSLCCLFP